jgi:hypothetical protein
VKNLKIPKTLSLATRKKPVTKPDPDGMNEERIEWAQESIDAMLEHSDQDNVLCDLLCNLMHWADDNGYVFEAELNRGRLHYEDETTEG